MAKKKSRRAQDAERDHPETTPDAEVSTPRAEGESKRGGPGLPLWASAVLLLQLVLMLAVFSPMAHNGGDTAGYVTLAHSLLENGTYTDLWHPAQLPHTKYPPVFPALLALAVALGARTWAALKVVPALFTTLSILGVYLWARDRRGAPFAAVVAVLTAGCHAVLWASHWELSEPPFMALAFFALWAFDRAGAYGVSTGDEGKREVESRMTGWLLLAGALTGLAYFTRSAGLPLVAAAVAWLAYGRRWVAAGSMAVGLGLPAFLWSLRGGQGAQYMSEFWMIDPYQPDLGRIGVGGLFGRVVENAAGYVTAHVPVGLLGERLAAGALLGVVLFALAGWAWARRLRGRPGVSELFVPLYLGVILLWPQVWSGDRFALPLIPILLFYAGERLAELTEGLQPPVRRAALAAAVLVVAVPAFASWRGETEVASRCGAVVRSEGPFACWGPRMQEFVQAAAWSGASLPDDAVVLARKPRIFYVMSGIRAEVFPFTRDSDRFLAVADSLGARYVVMDYLDGAASLYVAETLYRRSGAFCGLTQLGGGGRGQPPTQLLGILPPARRVSAEVRDTGGGTVAVTLDPCPAEMVRAVPRREPSVRSQEIPLLVGFRSLSGE